MAITSGYTTKKGVPCWIAFNHRHRQKHCLRLCTICLYSRDLAFLANFLCSLKQVYPSKDLRVYATVSLSSQPLLLLQAFFGNRTCIWTIFVLFQVSIFIFKCFRTVFQVTLGDICLVFTVGFWFLQVGLDFFASRPSGTFLNSSYRRPTLLAGIKTKSESTSVFQMARFASGSCQHLFRSSVVSTSLRRSCGLIRIAVLAGLAHICTNLHWPLRGLVYLAGLFCQQGLLTLHSSSVTLMRRATVVCDSSCSRWLFCLRLCTSAWSTALSSFSYQGSGTHNTTDHQIAPLGHGVGCWWMGKAR